MLLDDLAVGQYFVDLDPPAGPGGLDDRIDHCQPAQTVRSRHQPGLQASDDGRKVRQLGDVEVDGGSAQPAGLQRRGPARVWLGSLSARLVDVVEATVGSLAVFSLVRNQIWAMAGSVG